MTFSSGDLELFATVKSMLRNSRRDKKSTVYVTEAQLLWAGDHYLLVRSGPDCQDKNARKVWLYSKEWLCLKRGNPEGNEMLTLALAAIDPVHLDWGENKCRIMHDNSGYGGHAKFRNRRWGPGLLADLIEFAKEEDRTQPERTRATSQKHEDDNAWSRLLVESMKARGFEISGTMEHNGYVYPVDSDYSVSVVDSSLSSDGNGTFEFTPASERTIEVVLRSTTLDPEEFEMLANVLGQIRERRKNKNQNKESA